MMTELNRNWLDNIDEDSPLSGYICGGLDAVMAELETIPKDWHFAVKPLIDLLASASFHSPKGQVFLHKLRRIVTFMCMCAEETARQEKGEAA